MALERPFRLLALHVNLRGFPWCGLPQEGQSTDAPATQDGQAQATPSSNEQASAPATWHYDCGYFSVDLPASWEGLVEFGPEGHTFGNYHVDGWIGTAHSDLVVRFDGMAGDPNVSVSYGGGKALWEALNGSTSAGLTAEEARQCLEAFTNGAVSPSDARPMDEAAFASQVEAAMEAYVGPMISSSLTVG